jgi:hypothetical protein
MFSEFRSQDKSTSCNVGLCNQEPVLTAFLKQPVSSVFRLTGFGKANGGDRFPQRDATATAAATTPSEISRVSANSVWESARKRLRIGNAMTSPRLVLRPNRLKTLDEVQEARVEQQAFR